LEQTEEREHMMLANNWHPCTQMKDYLLYPPLYVARASGSTLTLKNGQKVIDAISSWWCCSLGHCHPRLKNALTQQAKRFAHVIFANATHDPIIHLGQKLSALCPGLNKVFYASDGSCAVEIALKMSYKSEKSKAINSV
jgi:adenosylmethionine-8-amino-7-oxononanoate aminotransferase